MVNVHIDPSFDDAERRRRVYAGDIVVYSNVPEVADFAAFTRGLITDVFAPHEPTGIHDVHTPDELADTLIDFKPQFIHHPESIGHVRRIVAALGADPAQVHADVPKLRTAFPQGGLSTGIAYAFQAHRDTWYGAPPQQINWWMPVWPAAADNVMEFFPRGFGNCVENNSAEYNYYVANAWRGRIKDFSGGKDVRVHPAPVEPLGPDEPRLTLVPPVGGIMLFSGDQLHASIPNTSGRTRYSIDFRTVDVADVHSGVGAPRADVACTGTALRDFRRLTDGAEFTEGEVAPYDTEGAEGIKVFIPS
ncbi:hypothetical protein [Pseudonocardia acidicola]|uniref:Phytanoyl-CoA dioxygenase PhyH n=1 Tax=Pseudonocardia acidicola TaxID=2724939 RepID=A0ABX1SCH6_9PSEU|nr:hypothetical protein [Pseudonocardia acidicola]NMH98512.1 hypothetical protein [Pseudonocardia acidicola]